MFLNGFVCWYLVCEKSGKELGKFVKGGCINSGTLICTGTIFWRIYSGGYVDVDVVLQR